MRTPKQIAASRVNGAKSKGPVTVQGKLNSSRNSTRHGLLAATIVLESEPTEPFLAMVRELYEEHQPCTLTEKMFVETIACARWRLERIWEMQKAAFDDDIASCDSTTALEPLRSVLALRGSPENAHTHELLLRYEIALDRQISRSLLRLQQLQDRRQSRVKVQPAQAVVEPIDPEPEKTATAKRTRQAAESTRDETTSLAQGATRYPLLPLHRSSAIRRLPTLEASE